MFLVLRGLFLVLGWGGAGDGVLVMGCWVGTGPGSGGADVGAVGWR
jgi:hypothetical protein